MPYVGDMYVYNNLPLFPSSIRVIVATQRLSKMDE